MRLAIQMSRDLLGNLLQLNDQQLSHCVVSLSQTINVRLARNLRKVGGGAEGESGAGKQAVVPLEGRRHGRILGAG